MINLNIVFIFWYSSGNNFVSVPLDNLFDCFFLLFEGSLLIFLSLFLSFLNGLDSFGGFGSFSSVDFSNALVRCFHNFLLFLLDILVNSFVYLALALKFLHFIGDLALLVHLFHSLGLVGCSHSFDYL